MEAGRFVINQRGSMIEGSISRVMYCDHIEVDSHPHIYLGHTILNIALRQPDATNNTQVLSPLEIYCQSPSSNFA